MISLQHIPIFHLSYSCQTTTVSSKLRVTLDESVNGNTVVGDASSDTLTVNASSTFDNGLTVASGATVIPSGSISKAAVNSLNSDLTTLSTAISNLAATKEDSSVVGSKIATAVAAIVAIVHPKR